MLITVNYFENLFLFDKDTHEGEKAYLSVENLKYLNKKYNISILLCGTEELLKYQFN
jgi:hypothetical protein